MYKIKLNITYNSNSDSRNKDWAINAVFHSIFLFIKMLVKNEFRWKACC